MSWRKILLVTISFLTLDSSLITHHCFAKASKDAGSSAAVFLRDGQGARALGMGGAYTAVGQGVSALFWNPGGMSFGGRGMAVMLNNNMLVDNASDQSLAYLYHFSKGGRQAVAVQGLLSNMGDIEKRDATGALLGSADLRGTAYAVAYGRRTKTLGAGVNVKVVEEDLAVVKGKATAADAGVLWIQRDFSFGAAVQNMGSKYKANGKTFPLASTYRLGMAYKPQDAGIPYLDRLTVGLDAEKTSDQDVKAMTGAEFLLNKMLAFRAGYTYSKDTEAMTGISFGLGVWTDFQNFDMGFGGERDDSSVQRTTDSRVSMEFDYAYLMRDVFSDLHRLSLTVHF